MAVFVPSLLRAQQPPLPEGYRWIPVAPDIFLVSQEKPVEGAADGNSVIIINEHDVVVIDSHLLPRVARSVIARIRKLTSNPVRYVINTHWHDDHNNGNQVYRAAFPEVEFIAHEETARAIREKGIPFLERRLANYRKLLQKIEEGTFQWEKPRMEPDVAQGYRVYRAYVEAFLPDLETLQPVPPSLTFRNRFVLNRPGREIQILFLGRGNTAGDAVVYLPRERILITGDLLVRPIPFAYDVYFTEWLTVLDKLAAMDAQLVIPGHGGPLHDLVYLREVQVLLQFVLGASAKAFQAGQPREELMEDELWNPWVEKFAGSDEQLRWAFRTYFLQPALEQAYKDLGEKSPE
jgi:glyoxylase-like metal-dependent hydrolase (beta-lactamase superfamily II)